MGHIDCMFIYILYANVCYKYVYIQVICKNIFYTFADSLYTIYEMKNIHIKISDELHLKVRKYQLEQELAGKKMTMMEAFVELIEKGLSVETSAK
ncbi:hypothetical protein GCM10027291_42020 [Telluribacter humicola]